MRATLRLALLIVAFMAPLQAQPAGAADPRVEGVWGIVGDDGYPKCRGTAVIVFRDGLYYRVLPKLGTLSGVRSHIMGKANYHVSGDRIEVDPVVSLSAPEPRRAYLIKRGGEEELVREGGEPVSLKRCSGLDANRLIP